MAEHMRRRICEQGRYTIPSRIVILAKAIALATTFVVRPKNCQIDMLGSSDEEESRLARSNGTENPVKRCRVNHLSIVVLPAGIGSLLVDLLGHVGHT